MTTFPTPVVPAAQPRPILIYPYKAVPDGLNGWFVDSPSGRTGHAFPRVVRDLDGEWFGRRKGVDPRTGHPYEAVKFAGEVAALAYIAGCGCDEIRFEEK